MTMHRRESRKRLEDERVQRAHPTVRWRQDSWWVLGAFSSVIGLILYVWWPLAEEALGTLSRDVAWWRQVDWLLLGNFLAMSVLAVLGADLRRDVPIALVGLAGGLAIEGWGTQTGLWTYYTGEAPPLWILPAWPIASLSWDRLRRLLDHSLPHGNAEAFAISYWLLFPSFIAWLIWFVLPTRSEPLTLLAVSACILLVMLQNDRRTAVLTFAAGAGLGYFLERWGTTRECWSYYTLQTPPAFAVLAHGMAAVAFWRTGLLASEMWKRLSGRIRPSMAPAERD